MLYLPCANLTSLIDPPLSMPLLGIPSLKTNDIHCHVSHLNENKEKYLYKHTKFTKSFPWLPYPLFYETSSSPLVNPKNKKIIEISIVLNICWFSGGLETPKRITQNLILLRKPLYSSNLCIYKRDLYSHIPPPIVSSDLVEHVNQFFLQPCPYSYIV